MIAVIILAFNEEKHIARSVASAKALTDHVFVVDSLSTDATVEIASNVGAKILTRAFDSHSRQFNWAVGQLEDFDWIIRLDADEYLTGELIDSIRQKVAANKKNISGFSFNRRITFLGVRINYGGIFPTSVVRMFRLGSGYVEDRLMDEHIIVNGEIDCVDGELIDDNQNSLSWWINKHNRYSSLEALEMLSSEETQVRDDLLSGSTGLRRKFKRIYLRLPRSWRAIGLFVYRFFIRLGFLDGGKGFFFHFYQGLWYRMLVDTKYARLKELGHNLKGDEASFTSIAMELDLPSDIVESKLSK